VIAAGGGASDRLFAIGHPLRGTVWESSSIAEIAAQARTLATTVAGLADGERKQLPPQAPEVPSLAAGPRPA
jgi:hypothetical protein